jgi:hypothetical protein
LFLLALLRIVLAGLGIMGSQVGVRNPGAVIHRSLAELSKREGKSETS